MDESEEIANEAEANIQCILNETEDYPFYDAEFILSQFEFATEKEDSDEDSDKDSNESEELDQLSLFDKSAKQLAIICEYYEILKSKLKKQEMIEKILHFENDSVNKKKVTTRYKIWNVMDKLKNDKLMKKYIIWI